MRRASQQSWSSDEIRQKKKLTLNINISISLR
jgi:hypothetical protein